MLKSPGQLRRSQCYVVDATKQRGLGWRAERREVSAIHETVKVLRELRSEGTHSPYEIKGSGKT